MAYNTKLVQARDLPKVWEDLLFNPAWKDGKLGVPNRPESWAVSLWKAKGERWTKEFLTKLFAEVKPQLRKEGQNAMIPLLAVGEFHAVIPASNKRTHQGVLEGAPVDFACPEPVPFLLSDMVAVKGSPNGHAAKLYLNWVLSKEGQIARQISNSGMPVHNQLQRKEFVPFGERVAEKQKVFQNIADEETIMPELGPFWNNLWLRGSKR
jgi:iron(III) transport system substrate-binding protein